MKLVPLTLETAKECVSWRNACIETLRTPFMLTVYQQEEWWKSLQDRNCPHKYYESSTLPVVCGLTNIDWVNRIAEISLIVRADRRGTSIGNNALEALKGIAFNRFNMNRIYGECYTCNNSLDFWKKTNPDELVILKERKFWDGKYYNSIYFSYVK